MVERRPGEHVPGPTVVLCELQSRSVAPVVVERLTRDVAHRLGQQVVNTRRYVEHREDVAASSRTIDSVADGDTGDVDERLTPFVEQCHTFTHDHRAHVVVEELEELDLSHGILDEGDECFNVGHGVPAVGIDRDLRLFEQVATAVLRGPGIVDLLNEALWNRCAWSAHKELLPDEPPQRISVSVSYEAYYKNKTYKSQLCA